MVSKTEFKEFARVVGGELVDMSDDEGVLCLVEPDYMPTGDDTGELAVSFLQRPETPVINATCTPVVGAGLRLSVEHPASEWSVTQTVDDGNLLTELQHSSDTTIAVYGPPAKYSNGAIELSETAAENEDQYLLGD